MKHNLVTSLEKFCLKFVHILEVDSKTSMVYMSYIIYTPRPHSTHCYIHHNKNACSQSTSKVFVIDLHAAESIIQEASVKFCPCCAHINVVRLPAQFLQNYLLDVFKMTGYLHVVPSITNL